MKLTTEDVESFKPKGKIYRVYDGGCLNLEIHPSGSKYWRFRYRFAGKENKLAIGVYPEVGLEEARARRDRGKDIIKSGNDPAKYRDSIKGIDESFSMVESRHIAAAAEALFVYCDSRCSKSRSELAKCKGCAHGEAWKHFRAIRSGLESKYRMPTDAEGS